MELGIYLIVLIAFIFGSVKLINKLANSKNKIIFNGIFWLLSFFIVFLIYNSVTGPIRFQKLKQQRLQVAVNKLQDIRNAQLAHKTIKGTYAATFEDLEKFIEAERFAIVERKDTSIVDAAKNRAYGITVGADGQGGYFKDIVVIDTLGYVSVKDSLFKDSDRYKRLNVVKIGDVVAKVTMKTGTIERNKLTIPVFEAKIVKRDVLKGLDSDMIAKEDNIIGVDEINGKEIILGSLEDINTNGNWPKKYGNNE